MYQVMPNIHDSALGYANYLWEYTLTNVLTLRAQYNNPLSPIVQP